MSDVLTQKSLQKMKQKLQNNMTNISVSELKTARKKTTLRNAIEAMSDEIESLQKAGLSYSLISAELEKVGLKIKGDTLKKYVLDIKNSAVESNAQTEVDSVQPISQLSSVMKNISTRENVHLHIHMYPQLNQINKESQK